MKINISIDGNLLHHFPRARISWFTAAGWDDDRLSKLDTASVLAEACGVLSSAKMLPEQIGQMMCLMPWRLAFSRRGIKPSQYRSSAEALVRRFAAGKYSAVGLPVVDTYNAISAIYQVPMGAYDYDKLTGVEIALRFGTENDVFAPLGSKSDDYKTLKGIPVYADGSQVICWCFNHRDSEVTCVSKETRNTVFVAESIDDVQFENHQLAFCRLLEIIRATGVETSAVRWTSMS